jgi:hypothetical protein
MCPVQVDARERRDKNEALTNKLLFALVDLGTLDAVEEALGVIEEHDEMVAKLGDAWRQAALEDDDDVAMHLEAYDRVIGDELEWEWWERQVFTEHAKQWAADALDLVDLVEDLLKWCRNAASLHPDTGDKAPNSMLEENSLKMMSDMERALAEADDMHLKETVISEAREAYWAAKERKRLHERADTLLARALVFKGTAEMQRACLKEALACADQGAYVCAKVVEGRERFAAVDAALRSQDGNLRFDVRQEQEVARVDLNVAVFTGHDYKLTIREDASIAELKIEIQELCRLPVAAQVLQFGLARIGECDEDRLLEVGLTAQYGVRHKVLVFSTTFYQEETAHVTGHDGHRHAKGSYLVNLTRQDRLDLVRSECLSNRCLIHYYL